MIRAILLAIDGFEYSSAALDSAVRLAERFQASITAVGVVDTPREITPQGEVEEFTDGRSRVQNALQQLRAVSASRGIDLSVAEPEGDLLETLRVEATRHDLVVIGFSTGFRPDLRKGTLDVAIGGLVHDGARPILAVRGKPASIDKILVAFDGSLPASRSIHMAALLGLTQGAAVQVLAVSPNGRRAEDAAERAATLLRRHGADAAGFGIASDIDPADTILSHAQTFEAGLVVMGAFGHSGLRDMLFGSCTRRLMTECSTALFLQH